MEEFPGPDDPGSMSGVEERLPPPEYLQGKSKNNIICNFCTVVDYIVLCKKFTLCFQKVAAQALASMFVV